MVVAKRFYNFCRFPYVFRNPRVLEKWMAHELASFHKGLVARRKSLKTLLGEEEPSCETRDGGVYLFDRPSLEVLALVCSESEIEKLRLPIILHFDLDVSDQCYINDKVAADVLRKLEGFGDAYPMRDGKMWLPNSLAAALMRRYKTIFQRLFLP